jgi:hypothetical protein
LYAVLTAMRSILSTHLILFDLIILTVFGEQ